MWKISFKNFLLTLQIVQFSNSLFSSERWIQDENNNILAIDSCNSKIDLGKLYETRILIRDSICKSFNVDCYSILQPMAGNHGVQIKKFLSEDKKKIFKKKYSSLSSANGFIDFGTYYK